MEKLQRLIEENRASRTDFNTLLPNLYGAGATRWEVRWSKDSEVVDVSFKILDREQTKK